MSPCVLSRRAAAGTLLLLMLSPLQDLRAAAAPATPAGVDELQEVVVFGRGEHLIGIASAASEGTVGGADLAVRPLLRVAELLEAVPGLIAAQHSGSGKANQYFLRGFNLDHGTDFSTMVDGVPWNLRSHGHGQGYLDVNGLIPEVVSRIDFRKGPYRADLGDFSLAGAAIMSTIDSVDQPFVSVEAGSYDWRRVAGGWGTDIGSDGTLLMVGQWQGYDGPWELPENLQHFSGYAKFHQQTGLGRAWISFSTYTAKWKPTEQIPERAIGTSICADRFCALDTTATGQTSRQILAGGVDSERWKANLYVQYYDWNMFSDPTYDFQIRQWDRRFTYGFRVEGELVDSRTLHWTLGSEGRYDDIPKVQVDHTMDRQFVDFVTAHAVEEGSIAAYTEVQWTVGAHLRLLGGLRADQYHFEARATQPRFNSGTASDSQVSPKVGAAWTVTPEIELYANWGRGFHSNDARGVAASDPPVPGLVPGEGREAGGRVQRGNASLTATYWWLDVDSELHFVGDSNSVEPGLSSARRGYELVGFWRPLPWLAIDANWTESHARYVGAPGEDHIPGAVESAGELGVAALYGPWELSARLRHLGPYALIEDDSERATSEQVVNLRAARTFGKLMVFGELLNVFDSDGKDIVYWYESYLPVIDPGPTEGRLSRSLEPRTLRVGLRYHF
jgi:outer membrane receptor protein involved in Fe transport